MARTALDGAGQAEEAPGGERVLREARQGRFFSPLDLDRFSTRGKMGENNPKKIGVTPFFEGSWNVQVDSPVENLDSIKGDHHENPRSIRLGK